MNNSSLIKFAVFLFVILCRNNCYCQINLIFNGDFELYSSCPTTESYPSQYPNYEIEKCLGWTAPTMGTSDYFSTCATSGCPQIPVNCLGEQITYSGNGYTGGFFYSMTGGQGPSCGSCITWWEYIQGQFINPLESGRVYKITFYLSLAEQSEFALAQLGMYISVDSIRNINTTQPLSVIPQIESPPGYYFIDSLGWMEFSGYYVATGGEKYITIGNFNDSISTDTLRIKKFDPAFPQAYYYLDGGTGYDVTDEIMIPNIFTPNGDGINDKWSFGLKLTNAKIHIFNRWGSELVSLNSFPFLWDGKDQVGRNCNDGIYFYTIESSQLQKNSKLSKGFIQLNR